MIEVLLVVAFIGLLIILKNVQRQSAPADAGQETSSYANVQVPNPETANPKDTLDFLVRQSADVARQCWIQLQEKGYKISPQLSRLYQKAAKGQLHGTPQDYWLFSIYDYQQKRVAQLRYQQSYSFDLAGVHISAYRRVLERCVMWDEVSIALQADNPFDNTALAVRCSGRLVGHVPRSEKEDVRTIISGQHHAFIDQFSAYEHFDVTIIILYSPLAAID